MEKLSYYTTCEECDTICEGVGEYDRESNTLHASRCPKCGQELTVMGWLDDEEEGE